MKKLLLTLSLVSVIFTSCTNDEDQAETAQVLAGSGKVQGPLVTKWTETHQNGNIYTVNYTYNGNKLDQITYNVDSSYSKYSYTDDLITKIEYFTNADELYETITLEYDANNNLIKETTKEKRDEANYEFIVTYTHVDANTIVEQYTDSNTLGETHEYEKTIYLEDNEIKKTVYTKNNYTTNFTYVTNNSPFKNVVGFNKIFFSSYLGEKGNNKALESKISHDTNVSNNYITFNNEGYPTEMTKKYFKEGVRDSSENVKIEYSL